MLERAINGKTLSPEEINDMEAKRIKMLDEAGIDEQKVLTQANKELSTWQGYFNENIVRGKDDINFVIRDQWSAVERSEFTRLFKPAMTFNKLYDATKKVVGEQRKNKPDLIVRSLTGRATQEQINLRADLVRTISYQSQNDLVYQTAFKSALMLGFGAFQILLDYESPMSFNQTIRYDLVNDPTRCSFDPTAIKPHKGDGNFCSRNYVFTLDEFNATYPYITNPVSYVDPFMMLDFQWQTRDTIVFCDYFKKEWYPLTIHKLSDGRSVTDDEWEKIKQGQKEKQDLTEGAIVSSIIAKEMPYIKTTRQTQDYRIMNYRLIRDQIIDFSEWPSRHLPIVFVDGDSAFIEGQQYTKSFIHEARDAQKCVNFFGSEIAAEIKNRRREQWIATPDNILGNEQMWRNPEIQNGALIAKPDPKTGQMPQKTTPWQISPDLMSNMMRATQDLKEILGFSESDSLQGRDISGSARRERKMEGSMSSYVWFDNLNQAIAQGGRVVNDLLPFIVGDEERSMMVTRKDGRNEPVVFNKMMDNGQVGNQITQGDFDVEIETGPSFAVQKEIALEFFQQTIAASGNPQLFNLVADLWAKNLDVQYMPQIAERLQTLVPPQILAKEQGKPAPPPAPPSPEEQMMHAEMQLKQQQLMERAQELQIRQQQHELEKAKLISDAHNMHLKSTLDMHNSELDMKKADMDFSGKIAGILADVHKEHIRQTNKKDDS